MGVLSRGPHATPKSVVLLVEPLVQKLAVQHPVRGVEKHVVEPVGCCEKNQQGRKRREWRRGRGRATESGHGVQAKRRDGAGDEVVHEGFFVQRGN